METFYPPAASAQRFPQRLASFIRLAFICSFLFGSLAHAQNVKSTVTLFSPIAQQDVAKLPSQYREKLASLQSSTAFKRALPVQFGNLAKIQRKGYLTFSVPGVEKEYTFHAQKVDASSELDYKWVGTTKDNLSSAMFISENGLVHGAFNLDQRHFQIYTLENGLSILLEDNDALEVKCGTQGSDHPIPSIPAPTQEPDNKGARMGVCTEPMRVLIVYTQAAADSVPNISQTINLSVQQYNQAIDNSGIGAIPDK